VVAAGIDRLSPYASCVSVDGRRHPLLIGRHDVMWDTTRIRYEFALERADPALISNVRCAAFVDHRVVLIDTEESGLSALPGGMLEQGEPWQSALERELLEETGTRPLSVEIVGRIRLWSDADGPVRPYLPFPEVHQVVTYAEVEVVGPPTNPVDGEHVLSVQLEPVSRAIEQLRDTNPFEAQLLDLIGEMRNERYRRDSEGSSL
jgi:ADP-ribose pyrophosphatase YjhB (NUDIX family)